MHCLHHCMCFSQKSVGFLEFLLRIPHSPTMVFSRSRVRCSDHKALGTLGAAGTVLPSLCSPAGRRIPFSLRRKMGRLASSFSVYTSTLLQLGLGSPLIAHYCPLNPKTNRAPKHESYVHTSRLGALRHDHQVSYLFLLDCG